MKVFLSSSQDSAGPWFVVRRASALTAVSLFVVVAYTATAVLVYAQSETGITTNATQTVIPDTTVPATSTTTAASRATNALGNTVTQSPDPKPTGPASFSTIATNITRELETTIGRLYEIHRHLRTLMSEREAAGEDVEMLQIRLGDAVSAIIAAENELASSHNDIAIVAASANQRATWPQVKARFIRAREQLVVALNLLKMVTNQTAVR